MSFEKRGRVDPEDTPVPTQERVKQANIETEAARKQATDKLAEDTAKRLADAAQEALKPPPV